MTYGFETYRTDTSVNLSNTGMGGVFIEVLSLDFSNSSGSKSYSMIPAGELVYHNLGDDAHNITVDTDPSGYARINWSGGGAYAQTTVLMIFAKKLNPSPTSTYGISLSNANNQVVADYNYPIPQFVSTVTVPATADYSQQCPSGYQVHVHSATFNNLRQSTNRIVLMNLPDTTADIWYQYRRCFIGAGLPVFVEVSIFAPDNAAYTVPTFHVYALDGPVSAGNGFGIQLIKADTSLVFDSSYENLSAVSVIPSPSYPTHPSINVYNVTTPTYAAILQPYYNYSSYTPDTGGWTLNKYQGCVRRVGSQFQFKLMWAYTNHVTSIQGALPPQNPSSYCIVANVGYVAHTGASGIPGTVIVPTPTPSTYAQYQNPPNLDVYEEDGVPSFSIGPDGTTAGAWYVGAQSGGDPSLYEVMVTRTSGTYSPPSGYQAVDTWYSLDTTRSWGQSAPPKSNIDKYGGFSYQIRIKSNLTVVSHSTFSLDYYRT